LESVKRKLNEGFFDDTEPMPETICYIVAKSGKKYKVNIQNYKENGDWLIMNGNITNQATNETLQVIVSLDRRTGSYKIQNEKGQNYNGFSLEENYIQSMIKQYQMNQNKR